MYFTKTRNVELSTIYYLETQINASWSGINITKSFTQATKKALPVVCIRLLDVGSTRLEIGDTSLQQDYGIIVDIFANHDGQRIDLAHFIVDKIKDSWVYYEHSQTSGDPETLERSADGRVHLWTITEDRKVDFGETIDRHDKARHIISFIVRKY